MFREKCLVLENKKIAPGHFTLRMRCSHISKKARPGQFVQIMCSDLLDPLLPRPFSFLTTTKSEFSILYQVVGKGTALLAQAKPGDRLWVLGPLGNGFSTSLRGAKRRSNLYVTQRLLRFARNDVLQILVGGGVGIPPLYHLAQNFSTRENMHVFLGARNKSLLLCENDFKKLGVKLYVATDDGSKGSKGFITEPLKYFLEKVDPKRSKIYSCGPTPMLKAVSDLAKKFNIDCEISVEQPMACGFGVCLGCAVNVRKSIVHSPRSIDTNARNLIDYGLSTMDCRYAMACTEGPVFNSEEIVWE